MACMATRAGCKNGVHGHTGARIMACMVKQGQEWPTLHPSTAGNKRIISNRTKEMRRLNSVLRLMQKEGWQAKPCAEGQCHTAKA